MAEEATYQNKTEDLYSFTKRYVRKFSKQERPLNDKNGGVISDDEGQKKKWTEHFQEVLNKAALTGDSASYKLSANLVLYSHEGRDKQRHQAIEERQICRT
ncbi:hypothetical protein DPMN_187192 [Dreissena polymorpha]|uniref:Uncharacterized protein n=1 Tax=Dreissena polymorpha TaxID=45954 RepID=A0A9D4DNL8_DREPO|nr:hypothetical protein DPMN_187192 [Dreissena polymorpha]